MGKRTFLFNIDWRDALRDYPAEVRYEVYDAIIEYAHSGTLLELKPLANMAFSFIKREMDENMRRYDATVEARSNAGKKGMARRWHVDVDNKNNKHNKAYQTITKITNITDNVYDNDISSVNIDNKRIVIDNNTLSKPEDFDAESDALKKDRHEISCSVQEVVAYYNQQIARHKARLRTSLTEISERRRQAIMARLKERGIDDVKTAIDKAVVSVFLNYEASNAPVDLDWIMRQNNLPKILEGKYDNRESRGGGVGRVHFSGETDSGKYKEEEEKWK